MLKSVEGIYGQGEIKLLEKPDNIPQKTKVIVTFLHSEQPEPIISSSKILTNEEIDLILSTYRQENRTRPLGLCKGKFITPDNFNEPLPDEILALFEGI
jgi:hypothetical protein